MPEILVLGAGGREHALLKALERTGEVSLHVAPGNAGMNAIRHDIAIDDPAAVVALAKEIGAQLVVIGPEVPLVAGVADALRAADIAVFGPNAHAARIEGSKAFAKEIMGNAGVRTAAARTITEEADLDAALTEFGPHYVVKDDGLAGGKGVVVTDDRNKARAHAETVLAAGHPVLLEEFLDGPEVSLFCLVDGETVVPLMPAQDHKRAFDGDEGPNTGGMGAYTPLNWLPDDALGRIVEEVVIPVTKELQRQGTPYSGLLYAGLVYGQDGPAVIEFNARFGDPETQAVLAMLDTPLLDALVATATGNLEDLAPLRWKEGAAVTVILAASGYPEAPRKGDAITGLPEDTDEAYVLHSGTELGDNGLVSAGGRVLSVVGTGSDVAEAREHAYRLIEAIELEGSFYRKDIGA